MKKPKLPTNPSRDTPDQREARLEYIWHMMSKGFTIASAVEAAGTSEKSYYQWLNKFPEILAAHEQVQIKMHDRVKEVAKLCALKALGDPKYQTSMIFYLKCQAGWNDGSGFTTGAQEMPSISFKKPRRVKKVSKQNGHDD